MTVQELDLFLQEHQDSGAKAATCDSIPQFLQLARLADEIAWIVRASGGLVRSYKRLKATAASIACCVGETPLSETKWDGLFFGVWSSNLSSATDLACDKLMERTHSVTRFYWTVGSDPVHTVYTAEPLTEDELSKAANENRNLLVHAVAMSLLPWNIPLQWLLLLEAFSVAEGEPKTKQAFAEFVRPTWDEGQAARIADSLKPLVKVPMRVELSKLATEAVVSEVLPGALSSTLWETVKNFYQNRSDVEVIDSGDGDSCGFLSLSATGSVRKTYEYLTEDSSNTVARLLSVKKFKEAADIAREHVIQGIPNTEGSEDYHARLERARDQQSAFYELLHKKHPSVASEALKTAKRVCECIRAQRSDIEKRSDDIIGFIETLAEYTRQGDGLPVRWEWFEDKDPGRGMTLVALPVLHSVLDAVKGRPPQQGLAIHIYHLLQPAEVTRAVLLQKQGLLSGGGLFADECR
ncbi:MAG: hypothetical protein ABFD94_16230 [Armatimonadia bacterium]